MGDGEGMLQILADHGQHGGGFQIQSNPTHSDLPSLSPFCSLFQVVLSACSSYFQTLFLDHPDRHPIVILKDVRSAELRTIIDFMYKGEVNVQYCQLSELLKTAESLKVQPRLPGNPSVQY